MFSGGGLAAGGGSTGLGGFGIRPKSCRAKSTDTMRRNRFRSGNLEVASDLEASSESESGLGANGTRFGISQILLF